MTQKNDITVKSDMGEISLDNSGAAIGAARVSPEKSYIGSPALLKKVIEEDDQEAWAEIKAKIDYTYENMDKAMSALDQAEGLLQRVQAKIKAGKKLLLKPNLVTVENIEPYSHLLFNGVVANTDWAFLAAVMRWFHDKGGVRYSRMCMGEAASNSTYRAAQYTQVKKTGRAVTPEAAYEGKCDDFYGGWGFYFVRRYLAETLPAGSDENPMLGYEESLSGEFVAPGDVGDRLMIYDLNRLHDDPNRGRAIDLPDGECFKSIVLHKAIVGGDPSDPEDCRKYPGCVLVNVPKLKVHSQAMFTNAIKNLGIGLYPLQANHAGCKKWMYGTPDTDIPVIKSRIPHQVWVPELDPKQMIPVKGEDGVYKVEKTGGLTGTMLDIIRAAAGQDVMMLHIVDGIETVNRDHQGVGLGQALAEGLIMASSDVAAVDLMCARYLFCNMGLKKAVEAGLDDGFGGAFPQIQPVPKLEGKAITTGQALDNPISRDFSIAKAIEWGMGQSDYFITGWDDVSGAPLASYGGRLGYVSDGAFTDIHTKHMYWDIYKMPWDLQKTFFGYLDAVDELEGLSMKKEFLEAFDETGDGVVSYEENGKKGIFGPSLFLGGQFISYRGEKDQKNVFKGFFDLTANPLRGTDPAWSAEGHYFNREFFWGAQAVVAMAMAFIKKDVPDQFYPDMTWGNGAWPSFAQLKNAHIHQITYGWKFPKRIGLFSLWGCAFGYADRYLNNSRFVGEKFGVPNPKAPHLYLDALKNGELEPLDFVLYVPEGFGAGGMVPHVQETSDPAKVFTAEFDGGKIQWPDRPLEE
ncbi:DUF362 domain-containing protein [Desulfatibacillum aliphaticivorans]|uniref:DUF362 domain-containing protein n=1 Tax=Desulfatibacillum aliphaticivorans TaxID=218208 RepID=UPI00041439E6|nr:DUF362 domain-containing protein [Desulfatibacillum aliphaticivorans]